MRLPKKGYATISVSEDVYNRLKKVAEKEFTSVPRVIEKLLTEHGKKVEVPAR